PVAAPLDNFVVRQPDLRIPPADPRLAVRRLAEDVEAPRARLGLEEPRLMRRRQLVARLLERHCLRRSGDDEDLESVESFDEFVEAAVRHGDLDVLVLSSLPPEEELDRPPRRDVPRNLDTVEQ